jgi:hypothetical protein
MINQMTNATVDIVANSLAFPEASCAPAAFPRVSRLSTRLAYTTAAMPVGQNRKIEIMAQTR